MATLRYNSLGGLGNGNSYNKYYTYIFHRLAYHQRVKDIVPESFHALVPELPEVIFKYANPGSDAPGEAMEQDSKGKTLLFLYTINKPCK